MLGHLLDSLRIRFRFLNDFTVCDATHTMIKVEPQSRDLVVLGGTTTRVICHKFPAVGANSLEAITMYRIVTYFFLFACCFLSGEQNLTSSSAFLFSLQNPEYFTPIKLAINTSEPTNQLQAARSLLLHGPVFGADDLFISVN